MRVFKVGASDDFQLFLLITTDVVSGDRYNLFLHTSLTNVKKTEYGIQLHSSGDLGLTR